ncbi:hypothetical protein KKA53_00005, partial [Candidatus Dependentiae bacterium]|nr:hypothetical protein [Candidatus Dependentiae bacterium]
MRKNIFLGCLIVCISFFLGQFLFPADLVLGDWTSVSTQEQVTFAGSGNQVVGFKQMNHGFLLQDQDASCTFNAIFPVSGQVDLNGGSLYLLQDLLFANSTSSLENSSNSTALIYGNDHVVELTEEISELLNSFTFNNAHIFLNNDLTIKSPLFFEGPCTINGRGSRIFVQDNGSINLDSTGELLLTVGGIRLDKSDIFSFDSQTSKIVFKDFNIDLASDVWFQDGHFEFAGNVLMSGPYTFTYDSVETSTIRAHSTFRINHDSTLKIGKQASAGAQPLEFVDNTGRLVLDNAGLHVVNDGLQIKKGAINVYGRSVLTVDSDDIANGLVLGDGTYGNDALLKIKNGSELEVASGSLVMNEYARNKLEFDGDSSQLYLNDSSKFYTHRILDLSGGSVRLSTDATIDKDSSAYLTANKTRIHDLYQDFYLTGSITDQDSFVLDQNDELILCHGNLSKNITVSQDNNALHGGGAISGNIVLVDQNSSLTWGIDAKIDEYSLVLNNGVLALERDLEFYQKLQDFEVGGDVTLSGTLDLNNHVMRISANDSIWTGSFYLSGNGSRTQFNAKVSLTGTWTING